MNAIFLLQKNLWCFKNMQFHGFQEWNFGRFWWKNTPFLKPCCDTPKLNFGLLTMDCSVLGLNLPVWWVSAKSKSVIRTALHDFLWDSSLMHRVTIVCWKSWNSKLQFIWYTPCTVSDNSRIAIPMAISDAPTDVDCFISARFLQLMLLWFSQAVCIMCAVVMLLPLCIIL